MQQRNIKSQIGSWCRLTPNLCIFFASGNREHEAHHSGDWYVISFEFSYFELEKWFNATNWVTKNKIRKTFMRYEFTTNWSSFSDHDYSKEHPDWGLKQPILEKRWWFLFWHKYIGKIIERTNIYACQQSLFALVTMPIILVEPPGLCYKNTHCSLGIFKRRSWPWFLFWMSQLELFKWFYRMISELTNQFL